MNVRRLSVGFGIMALVFGLLVIGFPGMFAFSTNDLIISVIGLVALIQAVRVLQDRHDRVEASNELDPEETKPTPPPGTAFEEALAPFLTDRRVHYYSDRVTHGLRSAAVEVLTRYEGLGTDDAESAVESGTWTTDRHAAGLLGGSDAPRPPVRARLRDMMRGESAIDRDVRHAVREIARRAGFTHQNGDPIGHNPRERSDDPTERTDVAGDRPTYHWSGVGAVAFVAVGLGIFFERPAVLLAAVVGIGFATYARSGTLPPEDVTIERTLATTEPEPGASVDVSVTVINDGDRFCPDVRIVDGVPPALAVVDGSPRLGTALRAGASETFTYAVEARRGEHAFEPARVTTRDLPGAHERETNIAVDSEMTCIPPLRELATAVPLRSQATQYVGRVQTPSGGEGVEFFATREYRSTDSMRHIDWNRRARTGELTTVEFREERSATVVIMIDARESSYVAPDPADPHALERSVEAAGRLYSTLTNDGDRVGLASMADPPGWLQPGSGTDHRLEARRFLATESSLDPVEPADQPRLIRWRTTFRKRLAPSTQILLVSPLSDEFAGRYARQFDEYGHPVTVISPDPTDDGSTGTLLAGVARELRIAELRGAEIPVVDWDWDESVDAAIARHGERWAR